MLSESTVYDMIVTKVNTIDTKILSTSGVLTKKEYNSYMQGLEKKT